LKKKRMRRKPLEITRSPRRTVLIQYLMISQNKTIKLIALDT